MSLASIQSSVQTVMLFCKKRFMIFKINLVNLFLVVFFLFFKDMDKVVSEADAPFSSPPIPTSHNQNTAVKLAFLLFDIDKLKYFGKWKVLVKTITQCFATWEEIVALAKPLSEVCFFLFAHTYLIAAHL